MDYIERSMLWFDNNPATTLEKKIEDAVIYYRNKYHKEPNICYIHPSMKTDPIEEEIAGLKVRTDRSILPNHFYVGIESGVK
jgi:hypothetical protein